MTGCLLSLGTLAVLTTGSILSHRALTIFAAGCVFTLHGLNFLCHGALAVFAAGGIFAHRAFAVFTAGSFVPVGSRHGRDLVLHGSRLAVVFAATMQVGIRLVGTLEVSGVVSGGSDRLLDFLRTGFRRTITYIEDFRLRTPIGFCGPRRLRSLFDGGFTHATVSPYLDVFGTLVLSKSGRGDDERQTKAKERFIRFHDFDEMRFRNSM